MDRGLAATPQEPFPASVLRASGCGHSVLVNPSQFSPSLSPSLRPSDDAVSARLATYSWLTPIFGIQKYRQNATDDRCVLRAGFETRVVTAYFAEYTCNLIIRNSGYRRWLRNTRPLATVSHYTRLPVTSPAADRLSQLWKSVCSWRSYSAGLPRLFRKRGRQTGIYLSQGDTIIVSPWDREIPVWRPLFRNNLGKPASERLNQCGF